MKRSTNTHQTHDDMIHILINWPLRFVQLTHSLICYYYLYLVLWMMLAYGFPKLLVGSWSKAFSNCFSLLPSRFSSKIHSQFNILLPFSASSSICFNLHLKVSKSKLNHFELDKRPTLDEMESSSCWNSFQTNLKWK